MVAPSDMDDETERLIRQLQQQDAAEYNRSRGLGARERNYYYKVISHNRFIFSFLSHLSF